MIIGRGKFCLPLPPFLEIRLHSAHHPVIDEPNPGAGFFFIPKSFARVRSWQDILASESWRKSFFMMASTYLLELLAFLRAERIKRALSYHVTDLSVSFSVVFVFCFSFFLTYYFLFCIFTPSQSKF